MIRGMSKNQQQRRNNKSRSNKRQGRPGPPPAKLAAQLVTAVGEDVHTGDPFAAEVAAAQLLAESFGYYVEQGDPEGARPAIPILALLAHLRDAPLLDEGLALLLAMRSLDAGPDVQEAADAALGKVQFLGGKTPKWGDDRPGEATFTGAWRIRDLWGDQETVYLGFRYDGSGREHTIAFVIDRGHDGEVIDAFVGGSSKELRASWKEDQATEEHADLLVFEELSLAYAGALLQDGIEGAYDTDGEYLSADALGTFALLESRAQLLAPQLDEVEFDEHAESPYVTELDELDARTLLERFLASPEYTAIDGSPIAAERIVSWSVDAALGGVARCGPQVASELLLAALPGLDLDAAATTQLEKRGLDTVRAWLTMGHRLLELPDHALAHVMEIVGELEGDFRDLLANPPLPTLGERLVQLMQVDGVDLEDDDAAQDWLRDFEALPEDDRQARLGAIADFSEAEED
ncbi:MAG: hypothetical protein JWM25_984 [Thermoleophilia bacterium]|nr:hypothetical protein [Thermoleophilia bacterium]